MITEQYKCLVETKSVLKCTNIDLRVHMCADDCKILHTTLYVAAMFPY